MWTLVPERIVVVWIWTMGVVYGILTQQNCDVTISARNGAARNATFASPNYPNKYPNNVHCLYKFIGRENQRVRIRFASFALQGRYPLCENDYLDVYAQLREENEDLLDAKLTGRFCGDDMKNLPQLVVSTDSYLILSFFTNDNKSYRGFVGSYEFFDDTVYNIGTEAPARMCGYTVRSENKLSGYIVSPTYPGMYPDNLFCYYKLQGKPGERIRLKFEEFSLFHGGEYCPFDYVKIYDGHTNERPVIGTFCGQYNSSTVIYSTSEAMHLEFVTGQGRIQFGKPPIEQEADFSFERRGFNITFEFSNKFVNLDFIKGEGEHVLGTECDQRIMKNKEDKGTITSPGYPGKFPEGIVCRYYLDGLMDEQNLEKVKIKFTDFNIPGNMPYCALGYIGQEEGNPLGQGIVKERFCDIIRPPEMFSNGPRMVLVLDTRGAVNGGLFIATYNFITDFGIPGNPISPGQCKFYYESSKDKQGAFNSPRYPAKYPRNTRCEYILRPLPTEQVVLNFEVFLMPDSQEGDPECKRSDYIAFYEEIGAKDNFTLMEKYCDKNFFPGPYATDRELKIIFYSNDADTNVGFKALFQFVRKGDLQQRCGSKRIHGDGQGGTFASPNHPRKYSALTVCQWTIVASRKFNQILIEFPPIINMEGKPDEDCKNAVVKIYRDQSAYRPMAYLCGKHKEGEELSYLSLHDSVKLTFITSPASLGARGFKVSWTEIHRSHNDENCPGFLCLKNNYCIADKLACNREPNCGQGDNSDEIAECMYGGESSSTDRVRSGSVSDGQKSGGFQILHIAIGTSISSFFFIIILICGIYHRRKFRMVLVPPVDHDHVEVRYVSAPTGCNTTDRLLMEERNDQNNARVTDSPRCQKVSMV